MKAIGVLLVDDQRSVRQALRLRLAIEPDITVVGEARDGPAALRAACSLRPDVVVMDYEMAGINGVQATRALAIAGNRCAVVMLSFHDDAATRQAALAAGVHAFVAKHQHGGVLLAAIRSAAKTVARDEDPS